MRFDHIGLVVAALDEGVAVLDATLGVHWWTQPFADPVNDVHVQFGRDDAGLCYELVAPLSARSPVRRALKVGANITNHVAYLVADLAAARDALLAQDYTPVHDPRPAIAYGGAAIQYFMSPLFALVELVEALEHRHVFEKLG